ADSWAVRADSGADGDYITPSSSNVIRDTNPKIETFAERDANGFAMTIMAMCVVFSALALLCVCFMLISNINQRAAKKKEEVVVAAEEEEASFGTDANEEAIAAIAMALHDHFDAHDRESAVLTINKVKRAYSPWSSKIYSMRHMPQK
ncbi:MAG: OadG family protein, partial [Muribaculaceae bacterium]|nr:OadG family protein [Muribaculaceae bacterium]